MRVMKKTVSSLCAAAVLVTGLVGFSTSASAEGGSHQMWTEDPLPRGGVVYFSSDDYFDVRVCDKDDEDGYSVWIAVSRRRGATPRYTLTDDGGIGCEWSKFQSGERYELPDGRLWYVRICLIHDGNRSYCDDNRGNRWRS